MDEKMDNSENQKMSTRKPPIRRRRSRVSNINNTRKGGSNGGAHDHPHPHPHRLSHHQDCVVNIAQTRREIVHALHLHRSTSSSSIFTGSNQMASSSNKVNYAAAAGNSNINSYRSLLMEPNYYLPFPQPIWSTTSPSIFPSVASTSTTTTTILAPAYHHHHPAAAILEEVNIDDDDDNEFEYWGDDDLNLASSYTWWLGFLESLDNGDQNQYSNKEEMSCRSYRNANININIIGDSTSMETEVDDQQSSSSSSSVVPDEWLNITTPATENSDDHHLE